MKDSRWIPALSWMAGAFALRTLLSSLVPLLPDETYYWEWTRRMQGGYFDHPPGIALLIRAGTLVFGDTRTGVRAGPAMAALVTHIAAALLAFRLAGKGSDGYVAASRASALIALMPLATLGLVLATPDAALFMSAMLALLCVERALSASVRSRASTTWWMFAGVALGAAFVSKYTAVLLPMGLVIACVVHPALRARFREPGPWIAGAVALTLFLPVVLWNRAQDWVSFRFQLGHGFNAGARGNPLVRELELIGGQLGLASPILFVLLMVAVVGALRGGWCARMEARPTDSAARQFAFAAVALVP
ncbi:MAG: glycosyltransferase family 39 protein, partial [Gemmatimonas sp.]